MRLPYGDAATIDIAKLTEYCLNPIHPRGKHKARVFESVLGMTAADAGDLHQALIAAARNEDAREGSSDLYETRYIIDFELKHNEQVATIAGSSGAARESLASLPVTSFRGVENA